MAGTDLLPADWPWSQTRGDTTVATAFTLERDDVAWNVDEAVAQVRERRARSSELVMELTTEIVGNVVTVGDGDSLEGVDPGTYYWDLQVTDGGEVLTVVGGRFFVADDVTNEEGS